MIKLFLSNFLKKFSRDMLHLHTSTHPPHTTFPRTLLNSCAKKIIRNKETHMAM